MEVKMNVLFYFYLFLSTVWSANPKNDEPVSVQILSSEGLINKDITQKQNVTVIVNSNVFEIIPGFDVSVITFTPGIPGQLERHWMNGEPSVTIASHIYEPQSIEYDWLGQNIYWLELDNIEVGDINGIYWKTLYNVPNGFDMAIDPSTRSTFCSFGGESPGIETAGMDGDELSRKVIVTGTAVISSEAFSVCLDTKKGLVYWSDRILRTIRRCSYDGSQLELVQQFTEDILLTTIDIYKDTIYWIQFNTLTVNMLSSSGESKPIAFLSESILVHQVSLPVAINITTNKIHMKVFDPNTAIMQDSNESFMLKANCTQLFLLSKFSLGFKCVCAAGFYRADNETCQKYEDIIMIAVSFVSKNVYLIQNGTEIKLNNDKPIDILAIDYGETDDDLIFSSLVSSFQLQSSTIQNFTQNVKPINSSMLLPATAVAYDWFSKNIYTSSPIWKYNYNVILVVSDSMYLYPVTSFYGRTSGLSLDCDSGLMFFSSQNTIAKLGMDGKRYGKTIVSFQEADIRRLTLDIKDRKVYWTTFILSNIEYQMWRCGYSGIEKERVIRLRRFLIDMFIFEDLLFIAEVTAKRDTIIYRINKHSKGDFVKYHTLNETLDAMAVYNHRIRQTGSNPCMINNGNCSHLCLISPRKPYYTCRCSFQYAPKADEKSCVLLKCYVENGGCGMDCIEIQGGIKHKCACRKGFILQPDNRTCTGDMGNVFMLKTSSGLVLIDIKRQVQLFMHLNITVKDITFNPIDRYLYVIRQEDYHIVKYPLGGKGAVILTLEERFRYQIDIDWLSNIIYWWNLESIWRFKYGEESEPETTFYKIKQVSGLDLILAVEIDFLNGNLYTSIGVMNKVGRVVYDTSIYCFKLTTFEESSLRPCKKNKIDIGESFLFQMTLDVFNLRLYIYRSIPIQSSQIEKLEVINMDGQNFKTMKEADKIYPDIRDLELFDDDLYAMDIESISRVNKQTGDQTIVFHKQYATFFKYIGIEANAINVMPRSGDDEECMDHEKCFGLVNKWICLKPDDICDGMPLCYGNYDEFLCSLCTKNCTLSSLEFICDKMPSNHFEVFQFSQFLSWESHTFSKLIDLKSLLEFDCSVTFHMETSLNHVKMYEIHSVYHLYKLRQMIMIPLFKNLSSLNTIKLIGLPLLDNLTAGDLTVLEDISSIYLEGSRIVSLPNLAFRGLLAVTELYLVNNKYLNSFDPGCFTTLKLLRLISITGSNWPRISKDQFLDQGNLKSLNLSSNKIQILEEGVFNNLPALKLVDLRFNRIILTSNLFLQSTDLELIYGDSFTICCIKPEEAACFASADDISSCRNLIGNRVLVPFLWLLGIMALIGNATVLFYRVFVDKSFFAKSYFIFVFNLGISDLVMALYMLIIALHDALYDGIYVWNDYTWRHSILCKIAGVLSMLSSEASLIFISLISLERYLIVKFTFGDVRISRKLAVILSLIAWAIACFVSVLPLLIYDDFYARSGVCIAIPLTKEINTGMEYAVVVFLGINFLISSFIPYILYQIYSEVKKSMKKVQSTQTGRDIQVAKRISIVVITDCLCWLPVGILVILSLAGMKTPSDVYSWVIILVLPLNAAINPYIYTFSKLDTIKIKNLFCMKKNNKRQS